MHKHAKVVGLLTILLFAGSSFAETYRIDSVHSLVGFSIRHLVSRTSGKFNDFSGTIMYDPKAPEKFSVRASIKTASIDTDNERRDNHLRSPDFFDAQKYPEITFESTGAKKEGDRIMVSGVFTMHGVAKNIVLPIEILGVGTHPMSKAPIAGFASEITLNRSDYGVNNWTDAAGVLGDEVKVTLNVEAVGGKTMANPCNPCAKANPCNPCAKGKNPCNPCAKAKNPCNPCAKGK